MGGTDSAGSKSFDVGSPDVTLGNQRSEWTLASVLYRLYLEAFPATSSDQGASRDFGVQQP